VQDCAAATENIRLEIAGEVQQLGMARRALQPPVTAEGDPLAVTRRTAAAHAPAEKPCYSLLRAPVLSIFISMHTSIRLQTRRAGLARRLAFAALSAAFVLAAAGCSSSPRAGKSDAVSSASPVGESSPAITTEILPIENGRRILVVYFSQGSATKRVAEDLARLLGADLERVVEAKPRKWGFFGFMGAGAASSMSRAVPIATPARDPAAYEGVVVCTPIWAWHLSPPMRSWLRLNKGKLPPLAAYVTVSHDTQPDKVAAAMAKESGKQPAAVAGFADRDFEPGNRALYIAKIGSIVEGLR